MPFRTGTGDIAACYSSRTSTESSAPRDSVVLASQDTQAGNILVRDHMIMTTEMPATEPEGGLDESGEHSFDAREAHGDDNPSEVQQSSTAQEVASSFTLQPVTGIPSMDSIHHQQHSPQNAHSDEAGSPFTPEFLVQWHWETMEDSCFEIQSLSSYTDSQSQTMEYIHKIEADLEHLKNVEESYTILCQRLAGSALIDKHSDKS
ncbi:Hypothetical predicted protein [Marmota monax]|uniref:Uncharacterized protein n=1 Tax=Marmota monax TaxID=9995 RepID=A0A5E4CXW9_MARMO|nr:Hypothetical predicted protein [Marmota monax]